VLLILPCAWATRNKTARTSLAGPQSVKGFYSLRGSKRFFVYTKPGSV
jgi:hypothetical protein